MNLSAEKLEIIQRICEIQDNDLISLIKNMLTRTDASRSDWWNDITQDEKDSIHRGLSDLQQGNLHAHSEIRGKYEKWVNNQVN
ncbi:MAG: hypothetical protein HGB23_06950 [Chlorobiaceae bacterium]|nr:hypothetical protein [Chlorobiaceae bacterium]